MVPRPLYVPPAGRRDSAAPGFVPQFGQKAAAAGSGFLQFAQFMTTSREYD
jgi:hypothetical protein